MNLFLNFFKHLLKTDRAGSIPVLGIVALMVMAAGLYAGVTISNKGRLSFGSQAAVGGCYTCSTPGNSCSSYMTVSKDGLCATGDYSQAQRTACDVSCKQNGKKECASSCYLDEGGAFPNCSMKNSKSCEGCGGDFRSCGQNQTGPKCDQAKCTYSGGWPYCTNDPDCSGCDNNYVCGFSHGEEPGCDYNFCRPGGNWDCAKIGDSKCGQCPYDFDNSCLAKVSTTCVLKLSDGSCSSPFFLPPGETSCDGNSNMYSTKAECSDAKTPTYNLPGTVSGGGTTGIINCSGLSASDSLCSSPNCKPVSCANGVAYCVSSGANSSSVCGGSTTSTTGPTGTSTGNSNSSGSPTNSTTPSNVSSSGCAMWDSGPGSCGPGNRCSGSRNENLDWHDCMCKYNSSRSGAPTDCSSAGNSTATSSVQAQPTSTKTPTTVSVNGCAVWTAGSGWCGPANRCETSTNGDDWHDCMCDFNSSYPGAPQDCAVPVVVPPAGGVDSTPIKQSPCEANGWSCVGYCKPGSRANASCFGGAMCCSD